ncbi:MAG: hypothetical protein H6510_08685 [Acidobacteria bacterium]|nr:hypothetical protein [Acidobacteriota bacterium]MCB9397878.1 hypothetical protein [Acidobacteriota bacterium]
MEDRVVLNRRRHIRFSPELLDIAIVGEPSESLDGLETGEFSGRNAGLILEESYSGCSLLFKEGRHLKRRPEEDPDQEVTDTRFEIGQYYRLQVGRLAPLRCVVRWRKEMEPGIAKIGFEFLE